MKYIIFALILSFSIFSADLKINDPAPTFVLKTHEGMDFNLESQKGKWTVLYFYPKAGTPGCTKEAQSFRDNLKNLGANVFGISIDSVKDQADFHQAQKLNFTLLADEKGEVTQKYGSKMPIINMSKRWTFVIDPDLIIKDISHDVDPATDSLRVAKIIEELKKKK